MIVPADVVLLYGSCVIQNKIDNQNYNSKTKIPIDKKSTENANKIEAQHIINQGSKV